MDLMEQQVHHWIRQNKHAKPQFAQLFDKHIAAKPTCQWLGDWNPNPYERAKEIADHSKANSALYQVVLYNIPDRDNGGFSVGGSQTTTSYLSWIRKVAAGLSSSESEGFIIVEPDALAFSAVLNDGKKRDRLKLLREALEILRTECRNAYIYIDAGHPGWLDPATAVDLLWDAGIQIADGISLNVANSYTTESCFLYGTKILDSISAVLGIIIDTSRNGAGPPPPEITGEDRWINAATNRLGHSPTLILQQPDLTPLRLHAMLWVKVPGESDGEQHGAPLSGLFWPEGAVVLIAKE